MNRIAHRQLAQQRLKWVHAKDNGTSYYKVGRRFNISPSTVRLWYLRWVESGRRFESLYNRRSKRGTPHNARRDIEKDLRALYNSGLRSHRLQKALKRRGHTVARSTLYANIKRLGLSGEPKPKAWRKRIYRVIDWPLGWVQADTMWPYGNDGPVQFTAIECASRVRFLCLYPDATADAAADFIRRCLAFLPLPVVMWHTDAGTEWCENFQGRVRSNPRVYRALSEAGVQHHIVIGRPQHQGRVERSHRIDREDFYRHFTPSEARRYLPEWVHAYNEARTHGGIGFTFPKEELERLLGVKVVLDYSLCR